MKKLSILIALLVVAAFGFAQEVAFDGEATLTVGFDLDTEQFGFKNEGSADLSVTWAFDDASAGGTGAFINLTDMQLAFDSEEDDIRVFDTADIEAGLIFAPLTITIYDAPDLAFDNAEGFEFTPDDPDDPLNVVDPALSAASIETAAGADTVSYEVQAVATGSAAPADAVGSGPIDSDATNDYYLVAVTTAGDAAVSGSFQGITITADVDPVSVTLMVASDGTWVENTENAVAFGAVIGATIDPLSVEAGVIYGPTSDADLGATVGVSGTFGPASVDIGFDLFVEDYDASVEIGLDLGVASVTSLTYLTGGTADLEMYEQVVLDASAAVEGLTFVNTTQLDQILGTDTLGWYNGTDLAYDLGGIKPFALVELYDTNAAELDLDLEIGVELTGQIELTTFTLKWEADSLLVAESLGAVTFATNIAYE